MVNELTDIDKILSKKSSFISLFKALIQVKRKYKKRKVCEIMYRRYCYLIKKRIKEKVRLNFYHQKDKIQLG